MKLRKEAEIVDFGEKIGGARKDMWSSRGLQESDLDGMTEAEKAKYVTRDHVWPLPNAVKAVENGEDPFIVFFRRKARLKLRQSPFVCNNETADDAMRRYIRTATQLREIVEEITSLAGIEVMTRRAQKTGRYNFKEHQFHGDWYGNVDSDLVFLRNRVRSLQRKCAQQGFPANTREAGKDRKKAFLPPQLDHVEREGPPCRFVGGSVTGYGNVRDVSWQEAFQFRGVEFGNWMSQADRQASMNLCFEGFYDLACACEMSIKDISFGGTLSLGFGSRGNGGARAHYEPLRQVINLTKMQGAGAVAHEWFHALDHFLGMKYGSAPGKLASEDPKPGMPKAFLKLRKAMREDSDGKPTDYVRGSVAFGGHYAKEPHGYWDSYPEMLARAFACYVKDILGRKSDYLIAHADCYVTEFENERLCAIPQDEERELFNDMFCMLFEELKDLGILHDFEGYPAAPEIPASSLSEEEGEPVFFMDAGGQFRLAL